MVVVEDHHPEGGIGEAVLSSLAATGDHPAFAHLAVTDLPGSGTTDELLDAAGISTRTSPGPRGPAAVVVPHGAGGARRPSAVPRATGGVGARSGREIHRAHTLCSLVEAGPEGRHQRLILPCGSSTGGGTHGRAAASIGSPRPAPGMARRRAAGPRPGA
ncbi:hypothetical protein O1L55_38450 [Streptomyces albulus]|nr:hypothetical protein [Streptomyces noursei]